MEKTIENKICPYKQIAKNDAIKEFGYIEKVENAKHYGYAGCLKCNGDGCDIFKQLNRFNWL